MTRRIAPWGLAGLAALGVLVAFPPATAPGAARPRPADQQVELARLDEALAGLEPGGLRFAALLNRRASLTGAAADVEAARGSIEQALRTPGASPGFALLGADLALRFHRLAEARLLLGSAPSDDPIAGSLAIDLALQEGRYDEARRGCEALLRRRRGWDDLARLAHITALTGDAEAADALYAEAEDALTAKQMQSFAWLELQRGLLRLRHGRLGAARYHYERAGRAWSGDWRVEEHQAELLGAERRFAEAAALYLRVVERTARPEVEQALGDLYVFMGRPDLAEPRHEGALAGYLDSVARGEVHYLHHLAEFHADVRGDGVAALPWARRDLALRPNAEAHESVAWALYREGRFDEALDAVRPALASGLEDAQLLRRASLIHRAAGRVEEGRLLLARAERVNPLLEEFHVHR